VIYENEKDDHDDDNHENSRRKRALSNFVDSIERSVRPFSGLRSLMNSKYNAGP
jgi:hypothetical protein